ncbi:MAG: FecR domain-containing protein [Legionellales bacterium]
MKRLILICLFLHSVTASCEQIATVLFTMNKVIAEQNHVQRDVTRGAAINTGDIIITAAGSEAKIKYTNGTLVSINPNSNFQTSDPTAKNPAEFNAKLNSGGIHYASTGKKKGVLKTAVVALAILGTEFEATITSTGALALQVLSGTIQITAPDGTVYTFTAGAVVTIHPDGTVTVAPTSSPTSVTSTSGDNSSSTTSSTTINTLTTVTATTVTTATTATTIASIPIPPALLAIQSIS